MRTRFEREAELEALRELTGRVPAAGDDGEDNREAVDAQINVIEAVLTRQQVYELYEHNEVMLNAALQAESWLRDDDEAPSLLWDDNTEVAA